MSVATRYHAALAASGHFPDAAQLQAVARFDALLSQLQATAPKASSGTAWWRVALAASLAALGLGNPARPVATPGLYLYGGVGRGKTFLMDLFFAALPPVKARRVHFNRFMQEVHARLRALGDIPDPLPQVADDLAREARVLCFDELHVNDIADAMLLGGLFTSLVDAGTTLVFTSNVPPAGLYRDGLQRQRFLPAIALLERHCDIVDVDGAEDHRLRRLARASIYLASDDPDTAAALARWFEELADGNRRDTRHLLIEDRAIPVVALADNVAWFEFAALCEGPRSQNDYVSIAREFRAVIVSGVPVFDETRENSARRFIALVDEFYDRRVHLIVSAATEPVRLYRGSRLLFEFDRTASRLIEMQSTEYLASERRR